MKVRGQYDAHLKDVVNDMGRVNITVRFCEWLFSEEGLRGSEITAVINGVRYELSCNLADVTFLVHEIVALRARRSYQLTLTEAKAIAVDKSKRVTLPCPEEVILLMRKCYWDSEGDPWVIAENRLTFLATEYGYVTGRRPSNFSLNNLKARDEAKGRDHNLLAKDVHFVTKSGSRVCSTDKIGLLQLVTAAVGSLTWSDTTKTTQADRV